MSILGDIRQRKIFKVAAVYAVVAWLIVQVVGQIAEPLGLPPWFEAFVIVLLAIGFPIALILGWIFDLTPEGLRTATRQTAEPVRPLPSQSLTFVLQGLVLIAVGFLVVDQYLSDFHSAVESTTSGVVTKSLLALQPFDRSISPGSSLSGGRAIRPDFTAIALSPDERTVVLRANGPDGVQLFRRPIDSLVVTAIPGTQDAQIPFFSPNGEWIGFGVGDELRRIPTDGGPASTIVRVPGPIPPLTVSGASWGEGDVIVFSNGNALWRVLVSGDQLEQISAITDDEGVQYRNPRILPGGTSILYTVQKEFYRWADSDVVVRPIDGGMPTVVIHDAADARYVSSGHLVFMRRGTLMAAPFDITSQTVTGDARALIDGVMQTVNYNYCCGAYEESGSGQVAIGDRGTLVYATGGVVPDSKSQVVWVDRENGTVETVPIPPAEFSNPRFAPDGRILVYTWPSIGGDNFRAWIYDGRTTQLLTNPDERAEGPIWSPDYSRVIYSTAESGDIQLHWRSADGAQDEERLATSPYTQLAGDTSADNTLAFVEIGTETGIDIFTLDLDASDREPILFQRSARYPALARDGRYIAYVSDQTNNPEVYVQPYPGPGSPVKVSIAGGEAPAWRADGRELYYIVRLAPDRIKMMAVPIDFTDTGLIRPGAAQALFEGRFLALTTGGPTRPYDVTPDGQRFLMLQAVDPEPEPPTELVLVQNWFQELRRLVPTER